MTWADVFLLSPEISMVAVAALVIVLDLRVERKEVLAWVAVAGLIVPLAFTGLLMAELAGWWTILESSARNQEAIHGIYGTLSVDRFAVFFSFLFILSVGLVILASAGYVDRFARYHGEYIALLLISAVGMMLLATARELISLYVALELSTLPLVALAAFSGDSRSSEAGLKLLLLGALSSGVLLYGMALTFGFTGTTHLAAIAEQVSRGGEPFGGPVLLLGVALMVAGFGFKIAAVPFQMWVPDVYEGAPTPVTAFLSVASKAAGFAVILRVFYTAFGAFDVDWGLLFAGLAAASMTVGNLVAIAQSNIKRMLAYSTIAHAGYMMVGLAAVAARVPEGEATIGPSTLLFYLASYALTNFAAFFAVIAITKVTRSEVIDQFAGMGRRAPLLALALAVSLVSLTGIPPTVGFMAKLFVFSAAVKADLTWLVVVGLVNSVVSAYYYLRVVRTMYMTESGSEESVPSTGGLRIALGVTVAGVLLFGIWPQALLDATQRAALVVLP